MFDENSFLAYVCGDAEFFHFYLVAFPQNFTGVTGLNSVENILYVLGSEMLWLEILFNEQFDLKPWEGRPDFQDAYRKVCRWFTTYRSLIQSAFPPRVSLEETVNEPRCQGCGLPSSSSSL